MTTFLAMSQLLLMALIDPTGFGILVDYFAQKMVDYVNAGYSRAAESEADEMGIYLPPIQ